MQEKPKKTERLKNPEKSWKRLKKLKNPGNT
jgi:hypothetical protein